MNTIVTGLNCLESKLLFFSLDLFTIGNQHPYLTSSILKQGVGLISGIRNSELIIFPLITKSIVNQLTESASVILLEVK